MYIYIYTRYAVYRFNIQYEHLSSEYHQRPNAHAHVIILSQPVGGAKKNHIESPRIVALPYMVVDQNFFIWERSFFANTHVTFAKLSRTPCLSFAEPMLGKDASYNIL